MKRNVKGQFIKGDYRGGGDLPCTQCGKVIHWYSRHVKAGKKFCCRKCFFRYNRNRIKTKCNYCNKEVIKINYKFNSNKNNFCNNLCRAKWLKGKTFDYMSNGEKIKESWNKLTTLERYERGKLISKGKLKSFNLNPQLRIKASLNGKKWAKHAQKFSTKRISSLDKYLYGLFEKINIKHEKNYNLGYYWIDVAIPEYKLAFEANVYYWHNKRPELKMHYKIRTKYINNLGWKIINLDERKKIRWEDKIINTLKNYLQRER